MAKVSQDLVLRIVPHIVGDDRGPLIRLTREHRSFESNLNIVREELLKGGHPTTSGGVDQALREILLKVTTGGFEILETEVVLE
jgi:hypothetical protein